jgi:hypothetical protein
MDRVVARVQELSGIAFNYYQPGITELTPAMVVLSVKQRTNNYLLMEEGRVLAALGDLKSGNEAKLLFEEALWKFQVSIKINPHDYRSFYNFGAVTCCLAQFQLDDAQIAYLYQRTITAAYFDQDIEMRANHLKKPQRSSREDKITRRFCFVGDRLSSRYLNMKQPPENIKSAITTLSTST